MATRAALDTEAGEYFQLLQMPATGYLSLRIQQRRFYYFIPETGLF
jgi:hypothetical protein